MKNILFAFFLCTIFTTSFATGTTDEPKSNESSNSYVILNNGERFDNISTVQWDEFNKTGNLIIGSRVLIPESMLWIRDTKGLWLMFSGYRYKCEIEGKVSVYRTSMTISKSNGLMIYAPKYFILLPGETELTRPLNYENLVQAIADDADAVSKTNKIHNRLINRDIVSAHLKIVQEYNK